MDRVERKLSACSVFLCYLGRLEIINSVISSTVIYAMTTFKLHESSKILTESENNVYVEVITPRPREAIWWLGQRLNTRSMLFRRHPLQQHETCCPMCNSQSEETIDHLFFNCEYAKQC
ncbi:LOW QUALITY PROTEIN: hypothetical protein U9M48_040162 [Paspalum notatum var. saurae]|uniref:Reverse transcriptase zinc-binding domain-containing protein n=1 Tax=Paspalum notatum var. saurae TaxID=547442 RepID=A0AAQ3UPZ0_PASNO